MSLLFLKVDLVRFVLDVYSRKSTVYFYTLPKFLNQKFVFKKKMEATGINNNKKVNHFLSFIYMYTYIIKITGANISCSHCHH